MQPLGVLVSAAVAAVAGVAGCLETGLVSAWNYDQRGADWHDKYYTCGGKQQSPIDIKLGEVRHVKARDHTKCDVEGRAVEPCFFDSLDYIEFAMVGVTNNGRNIQVNPTEGNATFGTTMGIPGEQHRVEFGGVMELKQFHFHSPSEHTIDGQHYPLEMHMVHMNAANETTVIAIFFELDPDDQDNEFLTRLGFVTNGLPSPGENIAREPSPDNIKGIFNESLSGDFFRYDGSLTTPPCTEAVHWYVMSLPARVSKLQVDEFLAKVGQNNRQVQNSQVVIWKNLFSLVDNNVAPACPSTIGSCPGDGCIQPVHGCQLTCRVMDEAIDKSTIGDVVDNWTPIGRFQCPESCPIRAPCTQLRDLRCIMGSDTVKFVLNWEGKMESEDMLNSGEITPSDCKYYVSTSQPDPASHECSTCNITGCKVCFNPEHCATCIDGYEDCSLQCPSTDPEECARLGLEKGRCCDKWSFLWNRIIPIIWEDQALTKLNRQTLKVVGITLGVLVFILLCLLCAPRRDQGGYEDACIMARLTLPRDYLRGGAIFPWARFWEWHVKDRCGEGIFLFFNFFIFVFFSVICIGATNFYFQKKNPQLSQLTGSGFKAGEFGDNMESEDGKTGFLRCPVSNAKALFLEDEDVYAREFTGPLFHAAIATWAVGLGLSFLFSILIEAWRVRFKAFHSEKNIAGCCLQVENLPRIITKAQQVEQWFESVCEHLGGSADDVVGASLGFLVAREDFKKLEQRCSIMVDEWQDGQSHEGTAASHKYKTEKMILAQRRLDAEVTSILNGADGSGYAYVVFANTKIAKEVSAYIDSCNKDVHKKESWIVKQFTGRASVKPTHIMSDFVKPLLDDVAKAAEKAGIPSVGLTPDNIVDEERNAVFTVSTDRGEMRTLPGVERVKAPPENIRWANLCMQREEVWVKITQVPARVIMSMLLLLCFFMPTGLVFARYARIKSGDGNQLLWKAISQVLAAIYASSYNAAMITALNCSESVGAVIRDGEDLVALTLVLISTAVLTIVNVSFTMNIMVPAYMDHMSIAGVKPTRMDAAADSLYNLIFPSLIAMRYIVEPCLKYFLPQILNRYILPKLVKVERTKYPRMLQWPEISPVWTYGDLILNTSLCCSIFFFITEKGSMLFFYFALVLLARYVWLAIVWCRASSYRRIGTAKLFRFALGLWSIPTGILAGAMGFWWMWHDGGLEKFPPRGLPNGPVDWDPSVKVLPMTRANTCFWVHIIIYAVLVLGLGTKIGGCLGKSFVWCCGDAEGERKRGRKTMHTYEDLKAKCPADFFNTNAPVVLASRRIFGTAEERLQVDNADARRCAEELKGMLPKCVLRSGKPLVPYEPGREYQQGKPFDDQYIQGINPVRHNYLPTMRTNQRITNAR